MELISFQFAIFVGCALMLYYLVPKKNRWMVLLVSSLTYYILICKWYVLFLLLTILSTYGAALLIGRLLQKHQAVLKAQKEIWSREERRAYQEKGRKQRALVMAAALLLNFGLLSFLKYMPLAGRLGLLLPLGISFYTFQSMGYVIDVYQEKVEPERNLCRLALFVSFFPQIIQGPIAVYSDLASQLYEGQELKVHALKRGALLVLWGLMKKLIIADRAVGIVKVITASPENYSGTFYLLAALTYALQLYTDFSGGIDIVRGIGEMFGITMAENFRRPYFARSLTEYWHRWHISLGNWCRNYIFYPLSISRSFRNMSKWLKPRCGKHISKVLPGSIASLVTFLVIGVWHGANWKYAAFGAWNGIVIMISELIAPARERAVTRLEEKTGYRRNGSLGTAAAVLWTFLLVLVGYYFDIAENITSALSMLRQSLLDFHIRELYLPELILRLEGAGIDQADFVLLLFCACGLFAVSLYVERRGADLREQLLGCRQPLRWTLILLGILAAAVFGYYGPGLNPADFVYMQF